MWAPARTWQGAPRWRRGGGPRRWAERVPRGGQDQHGNLQVAQLLFGDVVQRRADKPCQLYPAAA